MTESTRFYYYPLGTMVCVQLDIEIVVGMITSYNHALEFPYNIEWYGQGESWNAWGHSEAMITTYVKNYKRLRKKLLRKQ